MNNLDESIWVFPFLLAQNKLPVFRYVFKSNYRWATLDCGTCRKSSWAYKVPSSFLEICHHHTRLLTKGYTRDPSLLVWSDTDPDGGNCSIWSTSDRDICRSGETRLTVLQDKLLQSLKYFEVETSRPTQISKKRFFTYSAIIITCISKSWNRILGHLKKRVEAIQMLIAQY